MSGRVRCGWDKGNEKEAAIEDVIKRMGVPPSRAPAGRGRTVASILDEMGATRRL